MTPFLSAATHTALDRYHSALRRARRLRRAAVIAWFAAPIGGAPVIVAALVVSLVALGMGEQAEELRLGLPGAEVLR